MASHTSQSNTVWHCWIHTLIVCSIKYAGYGARGKQLSWEFIVPVTDYLHTLYEIPISQSDTLYLRWWRINALHATFTIFSHKLSLADEAYSYMLIVKKKRTKHKSPLENPAEHSQQYEKLTLTPTCTVSYESIDVAVYCTWKHIFTQASTHTHTQTDARTKQINPSDRCW